MAALQETVSALKDKIASLQSQLAAVQSNPALALGPFVGVDTSSENGVAGPHITFKGANIHIVSGSGVTSDNDNPTGLGNLIIGYNEPPGELRGTDRGGSHNLVIGWYNRFTRAAVGGIVAGELNTISNREAIAVTARGALPDVIVRSYSVDVSDTQVLTCIETQCFPET